jgi:hypothetical protein
MNQFPTRAQLASDEVVVLDDDLGFAVGDRAEVIDERGGGLDLTHRPALELQEYLTEREAYAALGAMHWLHNRFEDVLLFVTMPRRDGSKWYFYAGTA